MTHAPPRIARRRAIPLALIAVLAALGLSSPVKAQDRPVVVELYTSQGCSSCPPADALLADLADRDGVLALSFHVDYWDYIGWRDPFADPAHTERQRAYARALEARYVYTPQIVLDGAAHVVGSDRKAVQAGLDKARAAHADARTVRASLEPDTGAAPTLVLDGSPGQGVMASIWLVGWDDRHTTEVARGENRGRRLTHRHVVRALVPLGLWEGGPYRSAVPLAELAGDGGAAILIQRGEAGPILAALTVR